MKSLIDVSSVVYGGHNGSDRRLRGFPIGGIRKLFGIINAGLTQSDFVLCFDGGSIIKKELLPTYKAGRVPDYSVMAQIELAKELLTKCDIPFYYDKKYEADDFIYSVCCEFLKLEDDEKIIIYTDDRDLSCCVTDQISLQNVTSNGKCISLSNYEDRVVNGRIIPYNTILLWKIFHGDASDNYKSLKIPSVSYETLAKVFVDELSDLIGPEGFTQLAYADFKIFELILQNFKDTIPIDSFTKLMKQARIAYPFFIPVSNCDIDVYRDDNSRGVPLYISEREHMKIFGTGNFNRRRFDFYCTMLGLNKTKLERYVDKDSAEAQEFYRLLELRAKELSSGELAVNYSRNRRLEHERGATLSNMTIPE